MATKSKPEDFVYDEWRKHAKLAVGKRGAEGEAHYAIADAIQYVLQDWSPYGRTLVRAGRK